MVDKSVTAPSQIMNKMKYWSVPSMLFLRIEKLT